MNDLELDKLLRSAKVPQQSEEQKAEFPDEVVCQLSRPQGRVAAPEVKRPRFPLWATGFALACLAIGFMVGRFPDKPIATPQAAAKPPDYAKLFKEVAILFPDRLRGVIVRGGKMELVLADQPERTAANPLLVEICHNGLCRTVITFSGQKLDIDGRSIEVLTGANDRVIVLADNELWTSQNPGQVVGGLRINAHLLQASL